MDSINAYIDLEKNWLVIDASNERKASLVTAVLRKSLGSLPVTSYTPQVEIPIIMTDWVRSDSLNEKFQLLDEIDMAGLSKYEGGKSRYRSIPLYSKEIALNLEDDWSVTRVPWSYEDIVTFTIDKDFIMKGVRYLDAISKG